MYNFYGKPERSHPAKEPDVTCTWMDERFNEETILPHSSDQNDATYTSVTSSKYGHGIKTDGNEFTTMFTGTVAKTETMVVDLWMDLDLESAKSPNSLTDLRSFDGYSNASPPTWVEEILDVGCTTTIIASGSHKYLECTDASMDGCFELKYDLGSYYVAGQVFTVHLKPHSGNTNTNQVYIDFTDGDALFDTLLDLSTGDYSMYMEGFSPIGTMNLNAWNTIYVSITDESTVSLKLNDGEWTQNGAYFDEGINEIDISSEEDNYQVEETTDEDFSRYSNGESIGGYNSAGGFWSVAEGKFVGVSSTLGRMSGAETSYLFSMTPEAFPTVTSYFEIGINPGTNGSVTLEFQDVTNGDPWGQLKLEGRHAYLRTIDTTVTINSPSVTIFDDGSDLDNGDEFMPRACWASNGNSFTCLVTGTEHMFKITAVDDYPSIEYDLETPITIRSGTKISADLISSNTSAISFFNFEDNAENWSSAPVQVAGGTIRVLGKNGGPNFICSYTDGDVYHVEIDINDYSGTYTALVTYDGVTYSTTQVVGINGFKPYKFISFGISACSDMNAIGNMQVSQPSLSITNQDDCSGTGTVLPRTNWSENPGYAFGTLTFVTVSDTCYLACSGTDGMEGAIYALSESLTVSSTLEFDAIGSANGGSVVICANNCAADIIFGTATIRYQPNGSPVVFCSYSTDTNYHFEVFCSEDGKVIISINGKTYAEITPGASTDSEILIGAASNMTDGAYFGIANIRSYVSLEPSVTTQENWIDQGVLPSGANYVDIYLQNSTSYGFGLGVWPSGTKWIPTMEELSLGKSDIFNVAFSQTEDNQLDLSYINIGWGHYPDNIVLDIGDVGFDGVQTYTYHDAIPFAMLNGGTDAFGFVYSRSAHDWVILTPPGQFALLHADLSGRIRTIFKNNKVYVYLNGEKIYEGNCAFNGIEEPWVIFPTSKDNQSYGLLYGCDATFYKVGIYADEPTSWVEPGAGKIVPPIKLDLGKGLKALK